MATVSGLRTQPGAGRRQHQHLDRRSRGPALLQDIWMIEILRMAIYLLNVSAGLASADKPPSAESQRPISFAVYAAIKTPSAVGKPRQPP